MSDAPPPSDPRVYFAAERTLLAWVRTGITVIALGFVVARFGIFLRVMSPTPAAAGSHAGSAVIGTVLVSIGAVFTALAGAQFIAFLRTLTPGERPRSPMTAVLGLVLTFCMSAVGAMLAIYLWL